MGTCSFSRTRFPISNLLKSLLLFPLKSNFSSLSASQQVLDHQVFDNIPQRPTGSRLFNESFKLFGVVVRVVKTMDFEVTRKVRFCKSVRNFGFRNSVFAYGVVVDVFASGGLDGVLHCVIRDVVSYCRIGNVDVSGLVSSLLDFVGNGVGSAVVVNMLLKAFAERKMIDDAVSVFVRAKSVGLGLRISSCNFLLKCIAEAGEEQLVVNLFEDLKSSGPSPNVCTYNIMINYYCKGDCENGLGIAKAGRIMEEMEMNKMCPSVVTYGAYLHGLCRVGRVEYAVDYIRSLRCGNWPLNAYCYNAIIHGFCRRGLLREASNILEEMRIHHVSPDVYSYSILIDGYCRLGDFERALNLIDEMEHCGIKPDIISFVPVLCKLSKNGSMDIVLKILNGLEVKGYKHVLTSYNILIDGYCEQGNMESASKIFDEMSRNGFHPNGCSFNKLIHGYYKRREL